MEVSGGLLKNLNNTNANSKNRVVGAFQVAQVSEEQEFPAGVLAPSYN